jgi:hypothetical protein
MDKTDAIAFHPYELNPSRSAALHEKFRKIVDNYGFGDKIWSTEMGYPTGGRYPTRVSEKRFPEYIVKTCVLLVASDTRKLFWFQMFDPVNRKKNDSEDFFGLLRSREDYTSKGAEAFRLCAKYLSDTVCFAQVPQQYLQGKMPKSIRAYWFERENGSLSSYETSAYIPYVDVSCTSGTLVLWNESLCSKKVKLKLPGTNHQMHDIVSGIASPISAEIVIKTAKVPIFITWN